MLDGTELIIKYREVGDVTILDLAGRITIGDGSITLREAISSLLDSGQTKILLNFTGGEEFEGPRAKKYKDNVEYMDSTGAGTIQTALDQALSIGGQLKIVNVPQNIINHFMLMHWLLKREIEIFNNEEDALLSFQSPVPDSSASLSDVSGALSLPSEIYTGTDFEQPRSLTENKQKVRRLRVFLCHSSSDKQVVRALCRRLHSINTDPWLDDEQLFPGQDWNHEIVKAVRASDVVIVCLSKGAISKAGFVQKEVKYSLDVADEQPEGTIFIVPVKLEECEIPERLRRWQWVNLFETSGFARLMDTLRLRASTLDTIMPSERQR